MPGVIPYIATQIAFLVPAAAGYGAFMAAYYVSSAVLYAVTINLINKAQGGSGGGGTINSIEINTTQRGTTAARRIVLGTRRVAGVIVFQGVTNYGGASDDVLTYVIAMAGHQVHAIRDVWIDTVRVAEADIDSGGVVIGGQFAGKMSIFKNYGTHGQAASAQMGVNYPEWDSAHKGQCVAYIVVHCHKSEAAFPQGPPSNISALVDGALLYDPRLDSTKGGAGSHRDDDPRTWEFSRNPALQARWLLTGGSLANDISSPLKVYGLCDDDARIEEDFCIAAANICDDDLTGANQTPDGDDVRYRCDIELSSDQTVRPQLNDVLESMAGSLTVVHGLWRINAGAYQTPEHTLTQAHLYDDIRIRDTDSHRDRYNAVSAAFVDANAEYTEATTVLRTDSAYETQDGGERISIEISLMGVTNRYQADRLCEIKLRKSRMQRHVVLPGVRNILRCALGESIQFSHTRYGWSNRVFKITDRNFEFNEGAGRVTLTCQRDDAGVWTDLETADYAAGTSITDVFQSDGPLTPTNFTASEHFGAVIFHWDSIPSDATLEIWEHTSATPFSAATKVWEGVGTSAFYPKPYLDARYYWARLRIGNRYSGTNPAGSGLTVASLPLLSGWTPAAYASAGYLKVEPGGKVTKMLGTAGWNAALISKEGFYNGSEVTFYPGQTNALLIVGLSETPPTSAGTIDVNEIDYGFFCTNYGSGNALWYSELGVQSDTGLTYSTTSRLQITHDGALIKYIRDGVVIKSLFVPDKTFYLYSVLYTVNSIATIVSFRSQTAVIELSRKIVPDPEFSLSTALDVASIFNPGQSLWTQGLGSAPYEILATGGENGGYLRIYANGNGGYIHANSHNRTFKDKNLQLVIRFRRSGSVTVDGGSPNDVGINVFIRLYNTLGNVYSTPNGLGAVSIIDIRTSGGGHLYTDNVWYTETRTITLTNTDASYPGVIFQYFQVGITTSTGSLATGEIHIDAIDFFPTV